MGRFFSKCRQVGFAALLSVLIGGLCGVIGAVFAHTIHVVTDCREANAWLLYCLPLAGLLIVGIYALLRVKGIGTDRVLEAAQGENTLPAALAPAAFFGAALTHLCGGSAGKEGAALQIGGSLASLVGKCFRVDTNMRRLLIISGMGAFFSAVFGTPVGACVFAIEVLCVGKLAMDAFLPTALSSLVAFAIANLLGVAPERFLVQAPETSFKTIGCVLLIAIVCTLVGVAFCRSLYAARVWYRKIVKHEWLRVVLGGVLLITLTLLVGTTDYNGSGIALIHRVFENGAVRYEAFLLKWIFTVVTMAAGYKGGEIIPSFCIGATLGASVAVLCGFSVPFGAAIGMAAMFCSVTNAPLATAFIAAELFGGEGLPLFLLAILIAKAASGKSSLYTVQRFA